MPVTPTPCGSCTASTAAWCSPSPCGRSGSGSWPRRRRSRPSSRPGAAADTFDPGRELGPWLATIARRVAIDIHRREARRAATSLEGLAPGDPAVVVLPPSAEAIEELHEVRSAIDELPPDEREVIRLQHLEELTQTEVAERLGIPLGTVKSRSHRAHRHLAARLGHLRGDAG